MTTKISESGIIGNDGKLRLPMDRLNAYFAANKGKRIVVQFEAATPGSTAAQLAYYYNYIIPCVVKALYDQGTRISDERADRWLLEQCGNYSIVSARELNQIQMSEFLEWLKQFAAENLYIYIEDPKTI